MSVFNVPFFKIYLLLYLFVLMSVVQLLEKENKNLKKKKKKIFGRVLNKPLIIFFELLLMAVKRGESLVMTKDLLVSSAPTMFSIMPSLTIWLNIYAFLPHHLHIGEFFILSMVHFTYFDLNLSDYLFLSCTKNFSLSIHSHIFVCSLTRLSSHFRISLT